MTKKPKALYICDPILNEECNKHWCHINGGPCYMTENIKYAKVVGGGGMKQSIFDKIRSYLSGQFRRFSHHYFGCCNKITKNCEKCKYFIEDDMYKNNGICL